MIASLPFRSRSRKPARIPEPVCELLVDLRARADPSRLIVDHSSSLLHVRTLVDRLLLGSLSKGSSTRSIDRLNR